MLCKIKNYLFRYCYCKQNFVFQYKPTLGVYVEVQHRKIEIYSATLKIYTHFSGLRCVFCTFNLNFTFLILFPFQRVSFRNKPFIIRYLIHKYPVLAAILGTGTNMVFLCTVTLLSWYQFVTSESDTKVVLKVGKGQGSAAKSGTEEPATQMSSLLEKQKSGNILLLQIVTVLFMNLIVP